MGNATPNQGDQGMIRGKLGGLLQCVVLATMALAAVGCNQDQDKIKNLTAERDELSKQVADYRTRLAAAEAAQGQSGMKDAELARLRSELAAAQSANAKAGDTKATNTHSADGWEVGLAGDRVTLDTDILFSAGKADLTGAGKTRLDKIADDLKKQYANMPVRVYGFTDTDPIRKTKNLWIDNLDLSCSRAAAVTRYLHTKGVKANVIETIGMGENRPVAGNKAKSRRVEIVVIKKALVQE
jgi:chemotaxis protein MotB